MIEASQDQTQSSETFELRHHRIWKYVSADLISTNLRLMAKPYGTTQTMERKTGTVIARIIMKIMKLKENNLKQA